MEDTHMERDDEFDKFSEELYSALLAYTEGDMNKKVVNRGTRCRLNKNTDAGVNAYIEICAWHMGMTGLKLSERRATVMRPMPARNEEEIADAIDAWAREEMKLRKIDPGYSGK